jgi:polyhydroxyalkanoate synthesis regulator phasin
VTVSDEPAPDAPAEPSDAAAAGPVGAGPEGRPGGADPGRRQPLVDAALRDAAVELLGKLFRRGRVEVERAAKRGRERLTLRQLRTDRDRMYQKLGKETRNLLEAGEVEHPGLRRGVERIVELERKLQDLEDELRNVGIEVEREEEPAAGGESG